MYFSLEDVVLRHDLPNKAPPMSLVAPHLIFHNFTSRLGNNASSQDTFIFNVGYLSRRRSMEYSRYACRVI